MGNGNVERANLEEVAGFLYFPDQLAPGDWKRPPMPRSPHVSPFFPYNGGPISLVMVWKPCCAPDSESHLG